MTAKHLLLIGLVTLLLLPAASAQTTRPTPEIIVELEPASAAIIHGAFLEIRGIITITAGPEAHLQTNGILVDLTVSSRPSWSITSLPVETLLFETAPDQGAFYRKEAFTLVVGLMDDGSPAMLGDIEVQAISRSGTILNSANAVGSVLVWTAGGCHEAPSVETAAETPIAPAPAEPAPEDDVTVQAASATPTSLTPWIGAGALAIVGAAVGVTMYRRRG